VEEQLARNSIGEGVRRGRADATSISKLRSAASFLRAVEAIAEAMSGAGDYCNCITNAGRTTPSELHAILDNEKVVEDMK